MCHLKRIWIPSTTHIQMNRPTAASKAYGGVVLSKWILSALCQPLAGIYIPAREWVIVLLANYYSWSWHSYVETHYQTYKWTFHTIPPDTTDRIFSGRAPWLLNGGRLRVSPRCLEQDVRYTYVLRGGDARFSGRWWSRVGHHRREGWDPRNGKGHDQVQYGRGELQDPDQGLWDWEDWDGPLAWETGASIARVECGGGVWEVCWWGGLCRLLRMWSGYMRFWMLSLLRMWIVDRRRCLLRWSRNCSLDR